jgi:hypothetical protein
MVSVWRVAVVLVLVLDWGLHVHRELACGFVVAGPNTLVPFVSYVPSLARLNALFLVGRTRWAAQSSSRGRRRGREPPPTANRQPS